MNRIQKAKEILKKNDLKALIVDAPTDLFYLTGFELSLGRLVLTEKSAILYVDGRYFEQCQGNGALDVSLTRGYGKESAFATAFTWPGQRVGFDAGVTSYQAYQELAQFDCKWVPLSSPIKELRQIKEPEEIEMLKKASYLASKGYDYVLTVLSQGITEEEVAIELELFWKKAGGRKVSFDPHIAFGANTSKPHYRVGKNKLKNGDPVLIDIGVVVDNYHSDMTRVVFYKEVSSKMEEIYRIVQKAQAEALKLCLPGVPIKELDAKARDVIAKAGYGEYFSHSLGHGIGLEIHELPFLRALENSVPLASGMAITIEPGIYLPGIGGVRLEDSIVITDTGYENLTNRPLTQEIPIILK